MHAELPLLTLLLLLLLPLLPLLLLLSKECWQGQPMDHPRCL
jgi:hypothetical protein